jgi:hypothetical protein
VADPPAGEQCPVSQGACGATQKTATPAVANDTTPAQNTSSGGFFEKLGNWFHGNGWKTDAELHPSQSVIDKDKVANYMDAHANGTGNYGGTCAAACRRGLEAGGLNTAGHPVNAKDYGPFLTKHGATAVSGDGYKPEKGDVAVFQGGGRNRSGHIEIYDGKQWVSDTKQPRFEPRRDYPGSSEIYRFPD